MSRELWLDLAKKACHPHEKSIFASLWGEEWVLRFAESVAAAERERAIGIAKGMQEELQAKFEQTYLQGVIAGAAAEREACAKLSQEKLLMVQQKDKNK